MISTFEELLEKDGRLVYKTRGRSMLPMLRQNRDLVIIEPLKAPCIPQDVVLYKRKTDYVLHRIIFVRDDVCLIRGDNTFALETVPKDRILGRLVSFIRNGTTYQVTDRRYLRYVRFWCAIYPVRAFLFRCRRLAARIARKLGLLPAR